MHSEKYKKALKKLRSIFGSNFTDAGVESLGETLSKRMEFEDFLDACRHFIDNFEKKPTKMFPEPKDFFAFCGRQSKKTSDQKKWEMWAKRFHCQEDRIREYQEYVLEAAWKLGKMPWEMPSHASKLKPEERVLLEIPTPEENKAIFTEYYKNHPGSVMGKMLEKELLDA